MKNLMIATVAGFAGLATASPFFVNGVQATNEGQYAAPRGNLLDIDVSGINSWDAIGAAVNETLSVSLGGDFLVTGIGWDITVQTFGASWLSEATIGFSDSAIGLQLAVGAGDSFPGTATYTSGGILDLASIDPTFPFTVGADGNLDLEFFEGFDDVAGEIDATFLAGSTLTIQYVPTPGALAVLGLGGLVAGRRRR